MRLVGNDAVKVHLLECLGESRPLLKERVGDDEDLLLLETRHVLKALCDVDLGEGREKLFELVGPRVAETGGAENEERPLVFVVCHDGEGCNGLAEAHFVGEEEAALAEEARLLTTTQ